MKKYALLFPGQGSQYVGMGKKLYDEYTEIRDLYDKADDILGMNIKKLCFEGELSELTRTENAQPAIFLTGVAAYMALKSKVSEKPICMVGHSIGEITALAAAGWLDVEDALRLVQARGTLMGEAVRQNRGAMCAILSNNVTVIEDICHRMVAMNKYVEIANYNSYEQIVLSGEKSAVEEAMKLLEKQDIKCIRLNVNGAFHCKLMECIQDKFQNVIRGIPFCNSDIPVISNVTADFYRDSKEVPELLTQQIVAPVQWIKSMELLKAKDLDVVIDMGPGNVVKKLAEKCKVYVDAFAFNKENEKIFSMLSENISEKKRDNLPLYPHTIVTKCIAISVCTKNRNEHLAEYESGVMKPYKCLNELQEKIEFQKRKPNSEECKNALLLLKQIFDTKKTPKIEQKKRFREIFDIILNANPEEKNQWSDILLETSYEKSTIN